jgi:hypothetical protein
MKMIRIELRFSEPCEPPPFFFFHELPNALRMSLVEIGISFQEWKMRLKGQA